MKRVFLIVLDSCGCGAAPDSEKFGDIGVNTLHSCATSKYPVSYTHLTLPTIGFG